MSRAIYEPVGLDSSQHVKWVQDAAMLISRYQNVLAYLNRHGKSHSSTARLILFACISYEMGVQELAWFTGSCEASIIDSLPELTRLGFLVPRAHGGGSPGSIRYCVDTEALSDMADQPSLYA